MLVIQCGQSKAPAGDVMRLYTRGLWSTYRATRQASECALTGPHPVARVFVLSAEHGLLPETAHCPVYDRILVEDTYRAETKGGTPIRRVADLVPLIMDQAQIHGLRRVTFAGGATYRDALVRAGLEVTWMDERGIGHKRSSLRRWLTSLAEGRLALSVVSR